jgi:RNA polymerase sigma factor (sigma-70 family)
MTLQTSPRFDDRQFEAIYERYFGLLVDIATFKFQVPETEAETLVHDVLISYLRKSATVLDLRAWLIGAICFASRHYWRLNGRTVGADPESNLDRIDPASLHILDSLPDQLAARQALECMSPRCQQVVYMRYFEGFSIAEVAERLGVKPKYAQKVISKCLRRAEKRFNTKGPSK